MYVLKDGKPVKLNFYTNQAGLLVGATEEEAKQKGYKPWGTHGNKESKNEDLRGSEESVSKERD